MNSVITWILEHSPEGPGYSKTASLCQSPGCSVTVGCRMLNQVTRLREKDLLLILLQSHPDAACGPHFLLYSDDQSAGLGGAVHLLPIPEHRPWKRCWECYAWCPNPRAGREEASKTMQHAKKGKFIADSSQGSCHNQRSGAGSESPEPTLLPKFIECA